MRGRVTLQTTSDARVVRVPRSALPAAALLCFARTTTRPTTTDSSAASHSALDTHGAELLRMVPAGARPPPWRSDTVGAGRWAVAVAPSRLHYPDLNSKPPAPAYTAFGTPSDRGRLDTLDLQDNH